MQPPVSRPLVSFIGIGNMGFGMVARLLEQGWPVQVCDTDPQRCADAAQLGATVRATPRELAQAMPAGGLLVLAVVTADQCRDVLWGEATEDSHAWGADGAAAQLQPGQAVMFCPTIAPDDVAAMAQRLQTQGVHAMDAPMSGGPARARNGSMSLMVAGAHAVVEAHSSVLNALANPVFRLGQRVGDGARTKLVNNLLAGINLVGAAEVLALADAMGLDLSRTLDVIDRSSGQSWMATDRMRRAIAGDLAPRAHMTLLTKDTRLANEAATAASFAGPLGARAAAVFQAACGHGLAELDDAALLMFLQQHSAVR
jgi:L-threonate 2-dehydrogenase